MKNRLIIASIICTWMSTQGCTTSLKADKMQPAPELPSNNSSHDIAQDESATSIFTKETIYDVLVAEFAGRRQLFDIATKHYLKAATASKNKAIAMRATRVALYAKDTSSALDAAKLWAGLDSDNPQVHKALLRLYLSVGDISNAKASFEQLTSLTESDEHAFFDHLQAVITETRSAKHTLEFLNAINVDDRLHQPDILFSLASLYFQEGEIDKGLTLVEKANRLKPNWVQGTNLQARILFTSGETSKALAFLEKSLPNLQNSYSTRVLYARILLEARRIEEARNEYKMLLADQPEDIDILLALGLIHIELREFIPADEYLSQLNKLLPGNPNVSFYQGFVDEQLDKFDQAVRHYENVTYGNNQFLAQMQISLIYTEQKKFDKASAQLDLVRPSNEEESIQLVITKANIHTVKSQFSEALTQLSVAVERFPLNPNLLYARALVAEKLDDFDLVETDLRLIVKHYPDHAQALNALGYILADRTERLDEALALITKALKLAPNNPAMIDSMGWVQYRRGDFDTALHYLRQAYLISPDSEIAAHLGEVLWANGQKEEALNIWKQALERDQNNTLLRDTMNRLTPTSTVKNQ